MSADDQREQRGLDLDRLERQHERARGGWMDASARYELDREMFAALPDLIAAARERNQAVATLREVGRQGQEALAERDRLREKVEELETRHVKMTRHDEGLIKAERRRAEHAEETQRRTDKALQIAYAERNDARSALDAIGKERNLWAREMADLRDEKETARSDCEEMRQRLAEVTTERDVLTVNLADADVKVERVRKLIQAHPTDYVMTYALRGAIGDQP